MKERFPDRICGGEETAERCGGRRKADTEYGSAKRSGSGTSYTSTEELWHGRAKEKI